GRRQRRVERACDQWRQRGNAVVEFVVAVVLAAQRVEQGVALAFGRRIAVVAGPGGEVDVLHRVVQGVAETRAAEAAVGRGGSVERGGQAALVVGRRLVGNHARAVRLLLVQLAEAVDPPVAAQPAFGRTRRRHRFGLRRRQALRRRGRQAFAPARTRTKHLLHRFTLRGRAQQSRQRGVV